MCRTSCQNALRAAAKAGMVHVEERRQRGAKNLPNLITITSSEWRTWLARGPKARGFKNLSPTATGGFKRAGRSCKSQRQNGDEREPVGCPEAATVRFVRKHVGLKVQP